MTEHGHICRAEFVVVFCVVSFLFVCCLVLLNHISRSLSVDVPGVGRYAGGFGYGMPPPYWQL